MLECKAWASWVKMVEIHNLSIMDELSLEQVNEMDKLVLEHAALFDAVPEYNSLKRPKHHFLQHLAVDIWDYGPPRGYWCMGFEGFNKVIKRGAGRSGFKNAGLSIMEYWSVRFVRSLQGLALAVPECV